MFTGLQLGYVYQSTTKENIHYDGYSGGLFLGIQIDKNVLLSIGTVYTNLGKPSNQVDLSDFKNQQEVIGIVKLGFNLNGKLLQEIIYAVGEAGKN